MRLIAVLMIGAFMYVAVPMLWQRAIVAKVNEMSANSADMPVGNAVEFNYEASANLVNAIHATEINEEQMNEFEQVGAQAAADQAARQARAASDQAWAATH
ncbi:MAG: hypothetical protein HOP91_04545 [Sphingomonas sp.]|nr:hypothetical protein [Sphingomonas sp.]